MDKYITINTVLICLLVSVSSCNHQKHVTPQDNALYLVDLDEIELEDAICVSSYFNRVTPIILETNEDCLIKDIDNVQVVDSFIFILDREMQNLFCFNKTGKFLKKIGNKGAGSEEYKALSDFTIDPQECKIYLFDNYSWEVKVFDINGSYLSSFNCKRTANGQSAQIQYANNNLYLDFQPENLSSKKDAPLLCKFNRNTGDFEGALLSANNNNLGVKRLMFTDDGVFYCRTQENTVYIPLLSNTVFTLREDAVPYLSLHSKNFILESEWNDIDMSDPTTLPKLFNSSKILSIWSYRETDNYIFILYKMGKVYDMIYSKKDGITRLCNWFFDDLVYKSRNKFVTHYSYASDAKGIYNIIRYHDMPIFLDLVKSDETKLTKEQVAEIARLTEDSNPVLFYYEAK